MIYADQVIAEAREWIGTPFHHQEHMKHVGSDCIGLVCGVGIELGIFPSDLYERPETARFIGYSRQPDGVTLQAACDQLMVPADEIEVGCVVLMRYSQDPQHIAIVANYRHGGLSIIHALSRGAAAVAEHRLDAVWRSRIVAAYKFPGVY